MHASFRKILVDAPVLNSLRVSWDEACDTGACGHARHFLKFCPPAGNYESSGTMNGANFSLSDSPCKCGVYHFEPHSIVRMKEESIKAHRLCHAGLEHLDRFCTQVGTPAAETAPGVRRWMAAAPCLWPRTGRTPDFHQDRPKEFPADQYIMYTPQALLSSVHPNISRDVYTIMFLLKTVNEPPGREKPALSGAFLPPSLSRKPVPSPPWAQISRSRGNTPRRGQSLRIPAGQTECLSPCDTAGRPPLPGPRRKHHVGYRP